MKYKIFACILFFVYGFNQNYAQIKIHTIGDSTMEEKSTDSTANPNGQRGWAQMLSEFVVNGATVNDRAKSGTSSKSFYEAVDASGNKRFWATVTPQINTGDYVIIQFGHNDEKDNGYEGEIGTNPWIGYTNYLTKYVNEVRSLGATPILFTPIVRNYFSNGKITDKGAHNLGTDSLGGSLDYVAAMKKVASDLNCLLVDHTALTKAICESYGATKTSELIYNVGDGTHLGEYGATLYARLAVQNLISQGILTDYLNANPDLLISETNHAYGKCYINTTSVYTFSISGVDLSPAGGNITITVPDGFSVSTQQSGTYSQSVQIAYTSGNLSVTSIYIKFIPTAVATYSGNVVLTYGSSSKTISLSGEGISLDGAQRARAYWQLSSDATCVSSGAITVISESFSNMYTQKYATPGSTTTWSDGLITSNPKTQRNLLTGDVWPSGEIDINNDRYIQFGVTATKGTVFYVDTVKLYAGGAGGSGMRFRVYVSTDSLFSETTMIADRQSNASNTMYPVSYTTLTEISGEQSIYLRIYPWYNGTASGKTICLYGVTISGAVTSDNSTPVKEIKTSVNKTFCYPSITHGCTTLNYNLENSTDVYISVDTQNGKNILKMNKNSLVEGSYKQDLDLTAFPAGIYFCSVKSSKGTEVVKIVKQ